MPAAQHELDGGVLFLDTHRELPEIPIHGYANPQDLNPKTDIVDRMVGGAESAVRIVRLLGNFAAHRAVDSLDIIADKLRRD